MVPALLLLLVPATALVSLVPRLVSPPPNILLLVADDLGWADVPWRDPAVPAPNLAHLARTGLLLGQSYVQQVGGDT